MARVCKNCGEKLFPTDTFCGFCGEAAGDTSDSMERFSFTPRSLVGSEALTRKEREEIERAKRRFVMENAGVVMPVNKEKTATSSRDSEEIQVKVSENASEENSGAEISENTPEEKSGAEISENAPEEVSENDVHESEPYETDMPDEISAETTVSVKGISKEKMLAKKKQFLENVRLQREKEAAIKAENNESEEDEDIQYIDERETEEGFSTEESENQFEGEKPENEFDMADYEEEWEESSEDDWEVDESEGEFEEDWEEDWDESEDEPVMPQKVTSTDKKSYDSSWEEAEKRARAEQKEADRIKRKKRLSEKPKHMTRDIILMSIGIVILIIVLVWLIGGEIKSQKGNDGNLNNTVTPAGGESATGMDATSSAYPSDFGKVWDGSVATKFADGKGTEAEPYKIQSGSELAYLASEVNRGVNFEGEFFSLETDLNLGGLEWNPIGYYYNDAEKGDMVYSFNGSFAGNNHKIYNYKIATLEVVLQLPNFSINKVCGLFGTTYGAEITDLKIENCVVDINETGEGEILAGALVGCAYDTRLVNIAVSAQAGAVAKQRVAVGLVAGAVNNGSFVNVSSSGAVSTTTSAGINDAGLIAGYVKGAEFSGITASGKINGTTAGNLYCGGMVGYGTEVKVDNSSVNAEIEVSTTAESSKLMAGNLMGFCLTGEDILVKAEGTLIAMSAGMAYAGGAYGYAEGTVSTELTVNVDSKINVTSALAQSIVGGVYGSIKNVTLSGSSAMGCVNSTSVGTNYAGGIVGQGNTATISSMVSEVTVTANATDQDNAMAMCGGVAGNITGVNISDVSVKGSVTASSQFDAHTGGVAGYINGGTFSNVTAEGAISNTAVVGVSCGGFAGYACGEYTITDCVGSADRTCDGENIYNEDLIAIVANSLVQSNGG